MHSGGDMKNHLLLALAFSTVGCASTNSAIAKRDAIREVKEAQNAPIDVASYRSAEGVRGALWGMTEAEVIGIKGEPARRAEGLLMYDDLVGGDLAPTTYVFFEGHLAEVKSHFEQFSDRTRIALGEKYGRGDSDFSKSQLVYDFDKSATMQRAVNSAEQWDVALSVIGILGAVSSTAGGARSYGYHPYPIFWGPTFADRELTRQALRNAPLPAHETMWRTKETDLHLVTFDSGVTDLTWASKALGPKLVKAQISAAGVQDLARDL